MDNTRDYALFGGAFDPIGMHHEVMAMAIYNQTGMPVWFMPTYSHKFGKKMESAKHRLAMCENVANNLGGWASVFDYEIIAEFVGSTYDLMKILDRIYPDHRFHLVMGSDNLCNIDKWENGKLLLEKFPIIWVRRGGFEDANGKIETLLDGVQHTIVDLNWLGASSLIRQLIESNQFDLARRKLNFRTWNYIRENKLYNFDARKGD